MSFNQKQVSISDLYNPLKVWHIKRYSCSHYYINQSIGSLFYYSSFKRTSLNEIKPLFSDIQLSLFRINGGFDV